MFGKHHFIAFLTVHGVWMKLRWLLAFSESKMAAKMAAKMADMYNVDLYYIITFCYRCSINMIRCPNVCF